MFEAQQEIEKVIILDPENKNANEMIKLIEERRYTGPVVGSQMQQMRS